ncbi:hypothetical protein GCM10023222_20890 [Saccharopolyspora cebuensis]
MRLICAVWSEALTPGEVDVDIHQGRGHWTGVHSELLHHDDAVIVHGPEHLHRYGPVRSTDDLANRPRIQILGFDDVWQRLLPTGTPSPGSATTVDTSISALELAAAGPACAIIPERFARTAVATGRVSLALDAAWPMRQAHYLVRSLDAPPPSPTARRFLRWLAGIEHQDALLAETGR